MKVFMLGWEFPPFISGGLGTACYGLTKALSRRNVNVTFVLPRAVTPGYSLHLRLLSPQHLAVDAPAVPSARPSPFAMTAGTIAPDSTTGGADRPFANVTFRGLPVRPASAYQSAGGRIQSITTTGFARGGIAESAAKHHDPLAPIGFLGAGGHVPVSDLQTAGGANAAGHYEGDLMTETRRYARLSLALARNEDFDVIHAHDWMTFPAGIAVATATGKPLVVHVHSTEYDRSGDHPQRDVFEIERRGMHAATRVIAVSHLTKSIIEHRYGIDAPRIDVVYNGIENGKPISAGDRASIRKGDKIVLFLGRITLQKGPEYFIAAAKKVLEKYDRVKFVMAGTGDKVREIIELAAREGIGHKIVFTGFLRGGDVERVFKMADVYVMPSVSEPFGIAPLEAICHDVPVIISRTSGVSEVLRHVLKVDFWDTLDIANKIIAVLRHPPLSTTLREHADLEVRRLTWDDAAERCEASYNAAAGVAVGA